MTGLIEPRQGQIELNIEELKISVWVDENFDGHLWSTITLAAIFSQ